jgi:hypothetical protein
MERRVAQQYDEAIHDKETGAMKGYSFNNTSENISAPVICWPIRSACLMPMRPTRRMSWPTRRMLWPLDSLAAPDGRRRHREGLEEPRQLPGRYRLAVLPFRPWPVLPLAQRLDNFGGGHAIDAALLEQVVDVLQKHDPGIVTGKGLGHRDLVATAVGCS